MLLESPALLATLGLLLACQPGKAPAGGGDTSHGDGGGDTGLTTDGGSDGGSDGGADGGADGGSDGGADGGADGGGDTGTALVPQTVFINELMAKNVFSIADETGAHPDWVELFNSGDEDVSLAGWTLSDDLAEPGKSVLGDLVLPAHGYLVLFADGDLKDGPEHLSFSLSSDGEELGLYDASGQAVDLLRFDAQPHDTSAARVPDGSRSWVLSKPASPGAGNGGAGPPEPDADRLSVDVESVLGRVEDASELFDPDNLPSFDIELAPAAMAALLASPYEWVQGTVTVNGERYTSVGVRTKGENSWEPLTAKPSLKLKANEYPDGPGEIYGLKEITLNNMDNDFSMMHERLAYRLYREAGVPAARATHAWVTLNGDDYGLYAHLETVDEQMIARWFDDAGGTLFEQWDVDFYDAYVPSFQLEYGDDDRTNLQGLADAMELSPAHVAYVAGADHLSWESFLRYWAVGAVVGQFDSYPYSSPGDDCHVYDDPTSGVLQYIPHGEDETFYSPDYDVEDNTHGILAQTCKADPACEAAFVAQVDEVLDIADAMDLLGYFDEVQAQVAPLTVADHRRWYDLSYVSYYQDVMRSFIDGRRAALHNQIGSRP